MSCSSSSSRLSMDSVHVMDCLEGMRKLPDHSVDIIVCDPPYNVGKDFGNKSDKQKEKDYIEWCYAWLSECFRVMKKSGLCYVFGFSETLALIYARVAHEPTLTWKMRWLVWHYTNRVKPTLKFWQRTHESILCFYHPKSVDFNRDLVREPYSKEFLNYYVGRPRQNLPGRFNSQGIDTEYTAHPNGALPRDVIKVSALTGAYGKRERVDHPAQKPIEICEKLIKSGLPVDEATWSDTVVLVPFAGSGTECVAAKKLGCKFIGFEINPEYKTLCDERLESV